MAREEIHTVHIPDHEHLRRKLVIRFSTGVRTRRAYTRRDLSSYANREPNHALTKGMQINEM